MVRRKGSLRLLPRTPKRGRIRISASRKSVRHQHARYAARCLVLLPAARPPSRSEDWQRTVGCLPSSGQSKRLINCLLDGDEHDNSIRERLLEICQCAAEGISKAGGSPSEGQAVHISDDNDGGITGIAVEQPLLDTLLAQVNIVNVNQKLKQPLASSVAAVLASARAVATSGIGNGNATSLTTGRIDDTPDSAGTTRDHAVLSRLLRRRPVPLRHTVRPQVIPKPSLAAPSHIAREQPAQTRSPTAEPDPDAHHDQPGDKHWPPGTADRRRTQDTRPALRALAPA